MQREKASGNFLIKQAASVGGDLLFSSALNASDVGPLQKEERTDASRPLEGAEDGIIAIERSFAAENGCAFRVWRNGARLARKAGNRSSRSATTDCVLPTRFLWLARK